MDRIDCSLIEVKLAANGAEGDMTFTGYGAVFGNTDSYGDVIAKGAFADTISEAKATGIWPAMLSQHGGWGMSADDNTPIGVWTDMREDDTGLYLEGKFAPTQRGREMHSLMKMTPRPAISGLSIGFVPLEWTMRSSPEEPKRTLKKIKLLEVSPVTFPANGKARIASVKSLSELETLADCERILRSAGFSRGEATAFVSRIKQMCQGDPGMGDRSDSGLAEVLAALKSRGTKLPV